MTSRNWVKLFLTTLMIGGLTTAIVGYIVRWNVFSPYFTELKVLELLSGTIWLIGIGFLFSLVSQLGFFAYLTVHRFGIGIFKSVSLWNAVQVLLTLFALFDLIYFTKSKTILSHIILATILVIVGLIVAQIKAKQTNRNAFIPALFFMVVVTSVEWVPALRTNSNNWMFYLMFFGLLSCNVYQILILHKLNARSEQEREKIINKKPIKSKKSV
ncbi:MAG: KinB-signaling pathway activation protein [Bacillota bacterium]|nr:KinB-signaling pathway activation protein [Bacillota bacterium]